MNGFTLKKKGTKVELRIYDFIGGWDGVMASDVVKELKAAGNVDEIDVIINSPGGFVFDGIAIFNELKTNKAKVNVFVRGLAASAASVVAMAGDSITMEESSFLMIHNASGLTIGMAEDHRKTAEALDKMDGELAAIYARRSGENVKKARLWMESESWFTAKEAVDAGLADESVVDADDGIAAIYKADYTNRWTNMPDQVAAMLKPKPSEVPAHIEGADNPNNEVQEMADQKPPAPKDAQENELKSATITELEAACQGADAEFILAQMRDNATVADAQTVWIVEQQTQLTAAKKDLSEAREKKTEKPGVPPLASNASVETEGSDPKAEWDAAVDAEKKLGRDNQQAVMNANRKNPGLRQAMVDAANA